MVEFRRPHPQVLDYQNPRTVNPKPGGTLLIWILFIINILIVFAYLTPRLTTRCPYPAKIPKTRNDIKTIEGAIEAFKHDIGRYPSSDEDLAILVENSSALEKWQGPYIQYRLDPWENDYMYQIPGKYNPDGFDVISAGPDGKLETEDDLHN